MHTRHRHLITIAAVALQLELRDSVGHRSTDHGGETLYRTPVYLRCLPTLPSVTREERD